MNDNRLSAGKAFLWVISSLVMVTALFFGVRFSYSYLHEKWIEDERYKIVACLGKSRTQETVQPIFLEELMGLSCNEAQSLYAFDVRVATKRILSCPTFKKVKVSRLKPGIVLVDYELRRPVAEIADYENLAIDRQRVIFPMAPFITPKRLPKLYLGALEDKRIELAFQALNTLQELLPTGVSVELLDVSRAFQAGAMSEMVVRIEKQNKTFLLRLNSRMYATDFAHFVGLLPTLEGRVEPYALQIVDLRVQSIALIKNEALS